MNLLRITQVDKDRVRVEWRRGNDIAKHCEPTPFSDPLTTDDRNELRWYLEEYLHFPYGAEDHRAQQVEKKMAEWGESLFEQVFPKTEPDPDPRSFYREAVREGLDGCELCISSDDADFLNIPWELVRDPTPGRGYLAPLLRGLYRHRSKHAVAPAPESPRRGPFRILLVISRPSDAGHISMRTEARPVLDALRPLRPRVEVELLRPPTFDALQRRLNDRSTQYSLVHFDGHGVFAESRDAGHLAFEKPDRTADLISSEVLGQALASARVPLFVLSACQSAEEGKTNPYSSVASGLVAVGAKGVVAMSYSVFVTSATHFMRRFYEKLVERASLSEAVAAGRMKLYADADRDSVIGPIKLRDWIVPALYQQEQGFVPISEGARATAEEEDERPEVVSREAPEKACPEGRFGFIGRDNDVLEIERAFYDDAAPWVLLTGIGGTGKTELACGFARWYAETGGCAGGVFTTSFKEKADFGQVIGSIIGHATDFSMLPEEKQWEFLVDYLCNNPCLLVWDNFEPVAGYPEGAEPLAPKEERDKLSDFLKALRGGASRVLITTRKPVEDWLGIAYSRIELGGLEYRDAGQMAKAILRTVGKKPEDFKSDPEYVNLIRLLRGHPRSLEVVLSQLRTKTPGEIVQALQHRVDRIGEKIEDASLSYAFSLMSSQTRKHLPFIGLFSSLAHLGTLANFVSSGDEQEEVYGEVMGGTLDKDNWENVLEEAARGGLIRSLGGQMYELHPTIPAFLRQQLASAVGEDGLKRLDSEFMRFYAVWAGHFHQAVKKADHDAVIAVRIEEPNLLRALRLAELNEEWAIAQAIAQTLSEFHEVCGRMDEWRAIRKRLLNRVGRHVPDVEDRARADLWMFLLGDEANDALQRNDLAGAEAAYEGILGYLVSLNDEAVEPKIAVGYHQLGMIAEERHRYAAAEQWYRKALEICERPGLEREAAMEYHHLGIIALLRERYDDAEQWHEKALEINERLGLERDAADEYHHLGVIARERHRNDDAEDFYRKALEIGERLGLDREAAREYHHLGMIAQDRHHYDDAEQWYRKALEIHQRLGLEREAAAGYHHLGIIAQLRHRYDDAEQWYNKALEIKERLKHPPLLVDTLAQFGALRLEQDEYREAVKWFGDALAIAAEYEMYIAGRIAADLARLLKSMGEEEFTAAWKEAFEGQEPPLEDIREALKKLEEAEEENQRQDD